MIFYKLFGQQKKKKNYKFIYNFCLRKMIFTILLKKGFLKIYL